MRTILNVIWLVFGGIWLAALYFIAGVIACVAVVIIAMHAAETGHRGAIRAYPPDHYVAIAAVAAGPGVIVIVHPAGHRPAVALLAHDHAHVIAVAQFL